MDDMQPPRWFDGKISLGNIVTWATILVGLSVSYTWVQADVRELRTHRDETKAEIKELRVQRQADRDTLMEIKGDIRVIRQIVEQPLRPGSRPDRVP